MECKGVLIRGSVKGVDQRECKGGLIRGSVKWGW